MHQRLFLATFTAAAVLVNVACPKPRKTETPVKENVVKKVDPPKPKSAAETFLEECRATLAKAQGLLPQVKAADAPRTVEGTLLPYNQLLIHMRQSGARAGLIAEVHPDADVRDAARTCEQEVNQFGTALQLDRGLYDAIAAVDVTAADPATQRFVALTLRDFRNAGVDRDEATRTRLQQIDEEITKLGQEFAKALAEDVRAIEIDDVAKLAGMPQDWIDGHKPGADGKIRVTTDYPDYTPFMTYADDDALRKELYVANRSRGNSDKYKNAEVLQQVLALRAEKAMLLDKAHWADFITADKMMKSGKNAAEFIDRVHKLAKKRAEKDHAELLKQLKKHDKKAKVAQDWQRQWLEAQVKKDKYAVDSQRVRAYFPFAQVLQGLLDITSEIYDIQYVPVSDADAGSWHEDVQSFDVMRGATKLGRVHLDMHPRDGKYKHAAQFPINPGIAGVMSPEGALVCNFPKPGPDGPGLMEHDDVVTMFHEFGHLMHEILGGQTQAWLTQAGVATEWDFVEAPSQMFEEWAWSHETLSRFAKHHETGEVIPADLVAQMRKADKFGLGIQTVQQMFYAAISLGFHTADPEKLDMLAEVKRLQKKYTSFPYVEGTTFHTSFGHLMGYSAMYYTYMWSLVIAKDLLTPFEKKGLMNTEVTYAYRDKILAPGGSKDAAVLVKDFLGRDFSFKAFEAFLTK